MALPQAYKESIGYVRRADGLAFEKKESYYNRMAGFVLLFAATLQMQAVPHFEAAARGEPGDRMQSRPVANPLGAKAAWQWLARSLNQRPRPITATLLLAFLKPTAHVLAAAYPTQFPKLLRFVKETCAPLPALLCPADGWLSPRIRAMPPTPLPRYRPDKVAEMCDRLGDDAAEERAGMRLLDSYVDTTLKELRRNQGKLPPPDEADMPQVKEPDDTRDANDDW